MLSPHITRLLFRFPSRNRQTPYFSPRANKPKITRENGFIIDCSFLSHNAPSFPCSLPRPPSPVQSKRQKIFFRKIKRRNVIKESGCENNTTAFFYSFSINDFKYRSYSSSLKRGTFFFLDISILLSVLIGKVCPVCPLFIRYEVQLRDLSLLPQMRESIPKSTLTQR